MNDTQRQKIKRFLDDKVMSEAVYQTLLTSLNKPSKDRDVHILAARFLAVEILKDAWKELGKNLQTKPESEPQSNPGL